MEPLTTEPEIRSLDLGVEELDSDQVSETATTIALRSARSLKRAMPFLERQRARLVPGDPHDSDEEPTNPVVEGPSVVTSLGSPQSEWASVQLDANAILALMDGLFTSPPADDDDDDDDDEEDEDEDGPELGEQLTLAQRALMKLVCRDLTTLVVEHIASEGNMQLEGETYQAFASDEQYVPPADAMIVEISVEEVPRPWTIRVFIGSRGLKQAANASGQIQDVSISNQTLAQSVVPVPFNVVAELGRVTMKLSELLKLRTGDIVRLSSAASDPITVRVEGVPKFKASPVVSRGQAAVSIESRYVE